MLSNASGTSTSHIEIKEDKSKRTKRQLIIAHQHRHRSVSSLESPIHLSIYLQRTNWPLWIAGKTNRKRMRYGVLWYNAI
mmetsp:Transcript_43390/g.91144  ORF Transcript_43390/g.91144 Transcript_43390/m.91144 type:complete len:80 (+) Transcript_43390:545-784(+)